MLQNRQLIPVIPRNAQNTKEVIIPKDGNIYLQTTIQLMLSEQKVAVFLEKNKVGVKDRVKSILKMTSIKDIEEIKSILPVDPEWSDSNPIRKVLFEEFQLE